jgi:hypothetical protein
MTVRKPGKKIRGPALIPGPDYEIDGRKVMIRAKVLFNHSGTDDTGGVFSGFDPLEYLFCCTHDLVPAPVSQCNIEEV